MFRVRNKDYYYNPTLEIPDSHYVTFLVDDADVCLRISTCTLQWRRHLPLA